MSFERKKMEGTARAILAALRGIKGDSEKFGEALRVLTKHINDTKNTADVVNSRYVALSGKIESAQGLKVKEKESLAEPSKTTFKETEKMAEER